MAFRMKGEPRVALTWVGDGATKHGEAHEAFNFAATLKLPVVFVIQNNQVALGTRFDQHHAAHDFRGWGDAYGVPLLSVDGNHVLDVYAATRLAAAHCRAGEGPVFIEATTFRMGGHATHDVAEGRRTFAPHLFDYWGRRDPIGLFEEYLAGGTVDLGGGGEEDLEIRNRAALQAAEAVVTDEVERAAEDALQSRADAMPAPETAAGGVYLSGATG
ncbi:MAG: thiamine pyrophosphate-dependent enzyme, partial [Gemmatimonadota bacterium]|nr:thiamine pyrophosphate-dependent enzyme [Gemmatimonadota bacterium]